MMPPSTLKSLHLKVLEQLEKNDSQTTTEQILPYLLLWLLLLAVVRYNKEDKNPTFL